MVRWLFALAIILTPRGALALCDVIPQATDCFRGSLGCSTAPFALPDQALQLRVRPEVCDQESPGLGGTPPNACAAAGDVVLSLVFLPPGGPTRAVVRAPSCTSLASQVAAWSAALAGQGGSATCIPDPDLVIHPVDLGSGVTECRLTGRFPQTGSLAPPGSHPDFTLTGPVRVALTRAVDPLPTALAGTRCVDAIGSVPLVACIDELFETDGTCATGSANLRSDFSHFTALPRPNDFAAVCSTSGDPSSPCDDSANPDVLFALDPRGNVLAPVNWTGVLFTGPIDEFPPPQLVQFATDIEAFPGTTSPVVIPEPAFLASFTTAGKRVPPIFDPVNDPTNPDSLSLFGSTDARLGVVRLQRGNVLECREDSNGAATGIPCLTDAACGNGRSCGATTCYTAGGATNVACGSDADCAGVGGRCGPTLFDFTRLLAPGGGPGILPAARFLAGTQGFVPLEGLFGLCSSEELSCIVQDEGLAQRSLNVDADAVDPAVVTLRDRRTGLELPIGGSPTGTSEGIAAALLHSYPSPVGPFDTTPPRRHVHAALTGEGNCAAFLLAEPWEGNADRNGDGQVFDPVLQVFCKNAAGEAEEVSGPAVALATGLPALAVLPDGEILKSPRARSPFQPGGEALVAGDGLVYFLVSEARNAVARFLRADVTSGGAGGNAPATGPSISADGDVVCFASSASNLATGDLNNASDVFCHDFASGQTQVVSTLFPPTGCGEPSPTERGPGASSRPNVSPDGTHVCYESLAANLVPGDTNGVLDVLVFDRTSCQTRRASVSSSGSQSTQPSFTCSLSGDGQRVVFASNGLDSETGTDVFLRDLASGTTLALTADLAGVSDSPTLSADGTRVVFANSSDGVSHVVFLDLASGFSAVLGVGRVPQISADGNRVTFEGPGLLAATDVYVHDLATGIVEVGSTTSALAAGSAPSMSPALDGTGDALGFASQAQLVPTDTNLAREAHRRDWTTLLLERVDPSRPPTQTPALDASGELVAYGARVLAGSTPISAVFRRSPDPADVEADFSGDGALDDVLLGVLDTRRVPVALELLGPVTAAAVDGDTAAFALAGGNAFLRRFPCGNASCAPVTEDLGRPVTALAVSKQVVCGLVPEALEGTDWSGDGLLDDDVIACAPIGSGLPLANLIGTGGAGIAADALAIARDLVVFAHAPDAQGLRRLEIRQLSGGALVPIAIGNQFIRRFIVGANANLVGFDVCEVDVGADLNGDGDVGPECELRFFERVSGSVFDSGHTAFPCNRSACDPQLPFRTFSNSIRFLSFECHEFGPCPAPGFDARCDRNTDGDCDDVVIQEVRRDGTVVVLGTLSEADASDPLAGPDSGQGGVDQGAVIPGSAGRCAGFETLLCLDDGDCPPGHPCGNVGAVVFAYADTDGDGVFDVEDNCPFDPNPGQENADGDDAGDACEGSVCGNGVREGSEVCDAGSANGSPTGICTAACTPVVRIDVTESRVNPSKGGVVPVTILGSPALNLSLVPRNGLPPQMIDVTTLVFEGVRASEACSGIGAAEAHALATPSVYASHLGDSNGDGILDLTTHYSVSGAGIRLGDTQGCLSGALRVPAGVRFEARDAMNVR